MAPQLRRSTALCTATARGLVVITRDVGVYAVQLPPPVFPLTRASYPVLGTSDAAVAETSVVEAVSTVQNSAPTARIST